jgi:hypothetical protein
MRLDKNIIQKVAEFLEFKSMEKRSGTRRTMPPEHIPLFRSDTLTSMLKAQLRWRKCGWETGYYPEHGRMKFTAIVGKPNKMSRAWGYYEVETLMRAIAKMMAREKKAKSIGA